MKTGNHLRWRGTTGAAIVTLPVVPVPKMAVICVAESTVKLAAGVPPKLTAVAPDRFVPLTVTTVPLPPVVGLNEVIVGGCGLLILAAKALLSSLVNGRTGLPQVSPLDPAT